MKTNQDVLRYKYNAKANIPTVIFCRKLFSLRFPWTAMCLVCIFLDLGPAYLKLIEMSAKPPFNSARLLIHYQM